MWWEEIGKQAGEKVLAETSGLDLLTAGSSVLGAALSPAPAGPSRADSSVNSNFDSSGWTVTTGSGSASASPLSPWLLGLGLGLAVFGMLLWFKSRKKS